MKSPSADFTPEQFDGPDQWPDRWRQKQEALETVDWDNFRNNEKLMAGLLLRPTRARDWLELCSRYGVPNDFMIDNGYGNPEGLQTPFGFVTSSSLKAAICAWNIVKHLRKGAPIHLLEIGGGFGMLASTLARVCKDVESVTFLDARPCLQMQHRFLVKTANVKIRHWDPWSKFSLVTNVNSFGEMSVGEVGRYFGLIHEQLSAGGLLYVNNRIARVTDFVSYPYDKKWRHLYCREFKPDFVECLSMRLSEDRDIPHPASMLGETANESRKV